MFLQSVFCSSLCEFTVIMKDFACIFSIKVLDIRVGYLTFLPSFTDLMETNLILIV